jgi:hypothetical protein
MLPQSVRRSTIKFFPKGSTEAEAYSGARSEEAFVKFINEKAGTHRVLGVLVAQVVGGLLNLSHQLVKLLRGDVLGNDLVQNGDGAGQAVKTATVRRS